MTETPLEHKISKLAKLEFLLKKNQQIQQSLMQTRDSINERMNSIDEYISTYRLKTEYPTSTSILSFIKFQRNIPAVLMDQKKIVSTQLFGNCDAQNLLSKLNHKKSKEKGEKKIKKKKSFQFSQLPKQLSLLDFPSLAKQHSFPSGIEFYREWKEYNSPKRAKAPYLLEQEKIIVEGHKKYGNSWEKIGKDLQDRFYEEIYYEYHNRINPRLQTGRWNYRQSIMLVVLLEIYGVGNWNLIGEKMTIKSELQVRERYCNVIDPKIGKDSHWTPQMDEKLMEIAPEMNYCWFKISKIPIFNNKTDNCIWRRFRNNLIKKSKEEIQSLIPQSTNKSLIGKIIKFKESYDKRKRKTTTTNTDSVFDPNQRARSNRQSLSESMRLSIASNMNSSFSIPLIHSQKQSFFNRMNEEQEEEEEDLNSI